MLLRKLIYILLLLVLFLTGCGTAQESPKKVFQQALKESKDLQSFQVNMDIQQEIQLADMNKPMPMNMTGMAKIQVKPEALYQEMDMMGQKTKVYYVNDQFYVKPSEEDDWMKAPQEVIDQMNQLTQAQASPNKQLSQLEEFINDLEMEEKKDNYAFSIVASGDKMKNYVLEKLKQNKFPENDISEEQLQDFTIDDVKIHFEVDKETYYPQKYSMSMNTSNNQDGETTTNTLIEANYSQFNEIENIKIPEHIKKNAKDLE
ncbi:hypothetical protein SAMN05421676_10121 [Salinibacillus kushneri]|uniref:Lipoprotein n=1 Tax=Salinibacillus kushneri TaxID=237682 RepID=A0A1H9Y4C0_9BACI|nr:DUF6612 family protein [Salinibacillus kushneri]SES63719.1 hypothetical protein SAMN05421676_10121 [Salinibacillus kushneri]